METTKPTLEQTPQMLADLLILATKILEQQANTKEREEVMTREETAIMLSCNIDTITKWVKKGVLPGYMKGGTYFFLRSEILQSVKASKLKVA